MRDTITIYVREILKWIELA